MFKEKIVDLKIIGNMTAQICMKGTNQNKEFLSKECDLKRKTI